MAEALNQAFCEPCSLGTPPLSGEMINEFIKSLDSNWRVNADVSISRTFKFKDFKEALNFVNQIGELAEAQGHHPDIELSWGRVNVELTTHKIHGLSRNDFIMAARIDGLSVDKR